MNQTKKSEESFERIIDIAFELFLEQGYDKTTIRMITDRAGIHIGSLYYIFENKEDILQAVSLTMYDTLFKNAREVCKSNLTTLFYPAAAMLYLTSVYPKIGELIYRSFSTRSVYNEISKYIQNWTLNFCSPDMSPSEYRTKLFFVFGGLINMIGDALYCGLMNWRSKLTQFIETSFQIFCVDIPQDIDKTKDLICQTVVENKIVLLGKKLDVDEGE